jgi:hypothetical protein
MTDCVACGSLLNPVLAPAVIHPSCLMVEEPDGGDSFASLLKQQLTDIIRWYDGENPRSKQQAIGPSEIGDPCDRRLGYRLADMPACNTRFDPWAGIVGTALHSWLEKAVTAWAKEHDSEDWHTETTLILNEFVEGHADLYNVTHRAVIDWKSASKDVIRMSELHGPSPGYMIQTHLYGYMFEQAGIPVERVALVFLPRAGWLREMYVWSAPYERDVAENALSRLYRIAQQVVDLDVLTQSHRWEQVDHTPGKGCAFCPWFDSHRDPERSADETGCPGN